MRTFVDEAANPKYAHIERERRWLVNSVLRPPLGDAFVLIEDRYIEGTRLRLRRMTDTKSGKQALKLTRKYETVDPLARPIVTAYLDENEYLVFASLPARTLVKQRHHIADNELEFSIDRFLGPLDGLELVEIEWPDDAGLRAIITPLWTSCEVSFDSRYQGGELVVNGIPKD